MKKFVFSKCPLATLATEQPGTVNYPTSVAFVSLVLLSYVRDKNWNYGNVHVKKKQNSVRV